MHSIEQKTKIVPRLLVILTLTQFFLFISGFVLFVIYFFRSLPDYYAVPDEYLYFGEEINGSYYALRPNYHPYVKMTTLLEPIRGFRSIFDHAYMIPVSVLTFNFVNYVEHLKSIRHFFTDRGWNGFMKALQDSGFINEIIKNKLSTSVVVIGTPVLLKRGILNGYYAWQFEMPILITFESANIKKTQNQIVRLTIRRIPLIGPGAEIGIAVDSFVTSV